MIPPVSSLKAFIYHTERRMVGCPFSHRALSKKAIACISKNVKLLTSKANWKVIKGKYYGPFPTWVKDPHRLEYRFVVVDIINSDDDTCGGEERVRPTWCIVICGCYIQDVLQALKLGQGSGAETDQPYKDHRAIKSHIIKRGPS